jgi:2-polyprenyl-3-methyl-5-hydroxy-6-metoxy-1,4-benzoquinol methylase
MKISNPIYFELLRYKLIKKKNIIKLSDSTRDAKVKVYQDKKTKIIFLQKSITNLDYYKISKNKDKDRTKNLKKKFALIKIKKNNKNNTIIKTPIIENDKRRFIQHKNFFFNKNILDYGCGWGGFLCEVKNAKSLTGFEIRQECLDYLKNKKNIEIIETLNNLSHKFDIITLFHVLEHLQNPFHVLKQLKKALKSNGKIIIEVPSANDFLLSIKNLESFKKFTFWSEHLMLHTEQSIRKFLKVCGFKNIQVFYYQRYNFENHLGWFTSGTPGGHEFFKGTVDEMFIKDYNEFLKRSKKTDTLIAIADS